jgi:hypothetical protein
MEKEIKHLRQLLEDRQAPTSVSPPKQRQPMVSPGTFSNSTNIEDRLGRRKRRFIEIEHQPIIDFVSTGLVTMEQAKDFFDW